MKKNLILTVVLVVAGIISGCSGSVSTDTTTTTPVSGKVVDGYLVNATVFLDKNSNYQLDQGEPFTTTGQNGAYILYVDPADIGRFPIVALAIQGKTIDMDDGQPIQKSYFLSLPAKAALGTVISPMSTQVRELMETGKYANIQQAIDALTTMMGFPAETDVMSDYVNSGNTLVHTAAQNIAGLMGSQMSQVLGTSGTSTIVDVNRYRAMVGTIFNNLSSVKVADRTGNSYFNLINMLNSKLSTVASNEPFRNMSAAFRPGFSGNNSIIPVLCSNPIFLAEQPDSPPPGYIISFKDGVDVLAETNRLSNMYGFRAKSTMLFVRQFSVEFNSTTLLGQLRCEPSIKNIFYNAYIQPNN